MHGRTLKIAADNASSPVVGSWMRSGRLSDAAIGELSSDAEHVEILGYQDDGAGGVQPIKLVPRE